MAVMAASSTASPKVSIFVAPVDWSCEGANSKESEWNQNLNG